MQEVKSSTRRSHGVPPPQWLDELDLAQVSVPTVPLSPLEPPECDQAVAEAGSEQAQTLATSFLRLSRIGAGTFDLLHRYEMALWRQAAQILFMLRAARR